MAACEKLETNKSFKSKKFKKSPEVGKETRSRKNGFKQKKNSKKRHTYVSLRSFDNNILRSKVKALSKDAKTGTVNKTLEIKKKTTKTNIKSKTPLPSPPLNPTLPFVELDFDIVVDESTFTLDPSETTTTNPSSLPQKRKKLRSRKRKKSRKLLSTESSLSIPPLFELKQEQYATTSCNNMHSCCQKVAVLKVDMDCQWEDPSLWFSVIESSPGKTTYTCINPKQTKVNQDTVAICNLPFEKFEGTQLFNTTSQPVCCISSVITTCASETTAKPSSDILSVGVNNICVIQPSTPDSVQNVTPHSQAASHEFNNGNDNVVKSTGKSSRFPTVSNRNSSLMSKTAQNKCKDGLPDVWEFIMIDDNTSDDPSDQDIVYID